MSQARVHEERSCVMFIAIRHRPTGRRLALMLATLSCAGGLAGVVAKPAAARCADAPCSGWGYGSYHGCEYTLHGLRCY
jgi:hypothetical protein